MKFDYSITNILVELGQFEMNNLTSFECIPDDVILYIYINYLSDDYVSVYNFIQTSKKYWRIFDTHKNKIILKNVIRIRNKCACYKCNKPHASSPYWNGLHSGPLEISDILGNGKHFGKYRCKAMRKLKRKYEIDNYIIIKKGHYVNDVRIGKWTSNIHYNGCIFPSIKFYDELGRLHGRISTCSIDSESMTYRITEYNQGNKHGVEEIWNIHGWIPNKNEWIYIINYDIYEYDDFIGSTPIHTMINTNKGMSLHEFEKYITK